MEDNIRLIVTNALGTCWVKRQGELPLVQLVERALRESCERGAGRGEWPRFPVFMVDSAENPKITSLHE